MRSNCGKCVGETRQACDALFDKVGTAFPAAVENVKTDKSADVSEIQAVMENLSKSTYADLKSLGCTLGEAAVKEALTTVIYKGASDYIADVDTEIKNCAVQGWQEEILEVLDGVSGIKSLPDTESSQNAR